MVACSELTKKLHYSNKYRVNQKDSNMRSIMKVAILLLIITLIAGCSEINTTSPADESISTFEIPVPTAPGINVEENDRASVDYSNAQDGYVIIEFIDSTDKPLKVLLTAPHGEEYHYSLSGSGRKEIIPLTEGDGEYEIGIYEHIGGSDYKGVLKVAIDVKLRDELMPFIHPNQFVNYSKDSELVGLAAELTKNAKNTEDKIKSIYEYVVDNFTYDYDLAATVQSGYIPNLDEVLNRKEGICFDYSALVTAMLRSQGIPARLEIGYHGEEYHAWISKYCEENGWIDNRYHYDGEEWTRMDPTVESTERRTHHSRQHARDDDTYRLMYNY